MELISSTFRIAFREYCSGNLTLSLINNFFDGSGIEQGEISPERLNKIRGERRTLVEEYYASIDWTSRKDVQKFLKALSNLFRLYVRDDNNYLRTLLQEEGLTIEGNAVSFTNLVRAGTNVKNLIFATNGPKPEIILVDALNNDVKIVRNKEYCLIYEKPISEHGLTWKDLWDWWLEEYPQEGGWKGLCNRLGSSLKESKPESLLFETYLSTFSANEMPALIPQVYLHYDPYTIKQLINGKRLSRQRMDFLLLLPNNVRVVLEVDGKQHYSRENQERLHIASPELYAEMVAEDRRLKLAGYEIYRFGGHELYGSGGKDILLKFFHELFRFHSVEVVCDVF